MGSAKVIVTGHGLRAWSRRSAHVVVTVCALALLGSAPGHAQTLDFTSFDARLSTLQAGAHPDLSVDFDLTLADPDQPGIPTAAIRDLDVDLPPGIIGDLTSVSQCPNRALFGAGDCPLASQVGVAVFARSVLSISKHGIYLVRPPDPDNHTAWLAIPITTDIIVWLDVSVRTDSDYGLQTALMRMTAQQTISGARITLWGIPASGAHDADRFLWGQSCTINPPETDCQAGEPRPAGVEPKPFLTNPTACGLPLTARARLTAFHNDQPWTDADPDDMGQITGCDLVPFRPSVRVEPRSREAGAPAGYDIAVRVPQTQSPDVLGTSNLRKAVIELPEGVTLNPAAALGLETCSDEDLRLGSTEAARCPDPAKLGSVEIDAPITGGTLKGGIYLRPPQPGKLLRLAIVASGFGVNLKIPGEATPDPVTGRLTNVFDDLPQLPFQELRVRFKGGDRAPLTNPRACGTHTSEADLEPWSGQPTAKVTSSTTIEEDCGEAPFAPSFEAGMVAPIAGESSPFVLTVARGPREPEITSVGVALPPGVTGLVSRVPLCPQSAAVLGACGAESRIGAVTAQAGAGHELVNLAGTAYLTEGYGGAPFGLVFVVPAKAGPFDLGMVVVRSRILVNRLDATLSVDSESLPTILQGIPLNVRSLQIALDRPGFMLSPTSCDPMQIHGAIGSVGGGTAARTARFQVGGCEGKPFNVEFRAESSGRANRRTGASLKVQIGARPGHANLRSVQVTLPREVGPRLETIGKACVIGDFERGACPPASRVGSAVAVSPVLRAPLRGPVDLVVVPGQLPTLRVQLRGEVPIDLVGDVQISRTGATTTFRSVPDIPISSFEMNLPMGPSSLLTPSRRLCGERIRMPAQLTAHSGRSVKRSIPVALRDCAVRVMRTRAGRRSVSLTVAAPGAGRLTASGKGVRRARKTVRGQTATTLTLRLSGATRRAVAKGRRVRLRLRVAYRPARGAQARASRTSSRVTIRPARRNR